MQQKNRPCSSIKKTQPFFFIVLLAAMLSACSFFGEKAPLSEGLYLNYDFAGSPLRVTFTKIDGTSFYAALSFGSDAGELTDSTSADNRKIVDLKLKTKRGLPYEAGMLGPLWVPPASIKKGGSAFGDSIDEVRQWKGWQVGVIKASFGRGALSGEWYYDKNTGFLVGGMRATIMNADEGGTVFVLDDSNLEAWAGKF